MAKENALRNEEPLEMVKACGPTDAEMIQEMLANNGIESNLQGDFAANTIPATSDLDEVRIWVRREDADKARELIEGFFTPVGGDFDADAEEPGGSDV
jgi:hypothetical protein